MSSAVIRQALVPMLGGWLILMAVLAIGLRLSRRAAREPRPAPQRGPAGPEDPARADDPADLAGPADPAGSGRAGLGWTALLRHGLTTAAGGYVLLVAVVVGYYYAIARVGGDFIDSAFSGTAVLIAIAIPVFAVLSWLTEHRRARQDRPGRR
ncbi:MAG: hypothetical protein M0030_24010 [Actinomycetota bacterium]|nr:hypothetical protein [Actinomycetota bacterium]